MKGKPRWNWFRGKTARKHLLSYILVSMIPVIGICLLFMQQSQIFQSNQQESLMLSRMEEMKSEMDANISIMQSNALHFYGMVSQIDEDLQAENSGASIGRTQVVRQLETYSENFAFPCEILYYPRYGSDVYTKLGRFRYSEFQEEREFGYELDMIQFYKKLNSVTAPTMTTTRMALDDSPGTQFVYLSPIPPLSINPEGTIAFIADKNSINGMATKYCGDFSGYFFVFNSFFDLSYGLDRYQRHDLEDVSKVLSSLKGTGIIRHEIMGENFVTVRAVSPGHGLTYVFSIPYDAFYRPIREQTNQFLEMIGLILTAVLGIAVILAVNSYQPIRRLADDLLPEAHSRRADVFEQIHTQYKSIVMEQDSLRLHMRQQDQYNRQRALEDILYGRYPSQEVLRGTLSGLDMVFFHNLFFVATARLESGGKIGLLSQAMASFRPDGCTVFMVEMADPNLAVLLVNTGLTDAGREELIESLYAHLLESDCKRVTIGVGTVYEEPLNMDMSYYESLAALQEAASPISWFQGHEPAGGDYLCPVSQGAMLRQALASGNEEMSVEILYRMAKGVQEYHPSFSKSRSFCFYIVNIILQTGGFLRLEGEIDDLTRAASHSGLPEFIGEAEAEIRRVCGRIAENISRSEKKRVSDILDYIRHNIGNYDLSTEQVAKQFLLSESHVRRIMKEETGHGFTSYITALRFDYIKEQLEKTDVPVKELIRQIGYSDVSSFTRKFKAAEGVTPGQYRSLSRRSMHII